MNIRGRVHPLKVHFWHPTATVGATCWRLHVTSCPQQLGGGGVRDTLPQGLLTEGPCGLPLGSGLIS